MSDYTSVMVLAYSQATGKTIKQSMSDLNVDEHYQPKAADQLSHAERILVDELSTDQRGVLAWCRW